MQLKQELSVLISNCDVVGIRGGAVKGRGAVVGGEKKKKSFCMVTRPSLKS